MKKLNILIFLLLYHHLAFAQDKSEWAINIFTNNYNESRIQQTQGDWTVKQNPQSPVWGVEVTHNFQFRKRFALNTGLGLTALVTNLLYEAPTAEPNSPPIGDNSVVAPHFYVPLRLKYLLWQRNRFKIEPTIGIRGSFVQNGFLYSGHIVNYGEISTSDTTFVAEYDALSNPSEAICTISAEIGTFFTYSFSSKNAIHAIISYNYSNAIGHSGDYSVTKTITSQNRSDVLARGTYAQMFNFWSVGIGYQHSF
jgi:hypothetical protein